MYICIYVGIYVYTYLYTNACVRQQVSSSEVSWLCAQVVSYLIKGLVGLVYDIRWPQKASERVRDMTNEYLDFDSLLCGYMCPVGKKVQKHSANSCDGMSFQTSDDSTVPNN